MFFVLVAVYLLTKRRWVWVLPVLVASVLVKYVSAILLLPFGLYCLARYDRWRARWRYLAATTALSALVFFAITARFLSVPTGLLDEANWYSLLAAPTLVFHLVKESVGEVSAKPMVVMGSAAVYLIVYLVSLHFSKYRDDPRGLIALATWLHAAYLVIACVAFMPWFIKWPIALGIWLNHALTRRILLIFTATGLLSYGATFLWVWNYGEWQRIQVNAAYVAIIFAPPILAWLVGLAQNAYHAQVAAARALIEVE